MTTMVRLQVAVDTPQHAGLSGALDYLSEHPLSPGTLVRAPLGRRDLLGIVWSQGAGALAESELRPLTAVLGELPPLDDAWRALVDFASGYYQRGLGELALAVLPPELHKLDGGQLAARLRKLHKAMALPPDAVAEVAPAPSEAQAAVLDQLAQAPPAVPVLLHGITGSGKTEIYLHAAARALDAGRQALVLVPEINLTPQLEARFAARFTGRRIVSLHSGLTPAQRLRSWLAAHLGLADLVLGTRMAVFAPMPRLGLIVVDEEHDPSYKQQEGARYSARDLAVYRARLQDARVLLGSATPSLESWQRANEGRYLRLSLPARIGGASLPRVRLVDMNQQPKGQGAGTALSPPLIEAIRQRIARGEQSLVFLNRRGYAPVLHCADCGWKSGCPHCSAWRVFHKLDRTLRCHHCGFTERVPRACPDCGNLDIAPIGRGTERLEEQIAQLLAGDDGRPPRIARIDADSTRLKGSLEAQLGAVHAGEVDVLVGTQMITKGHDFRRITLVAAVNPDSALFSSDFRAPERLFALLMQAGGRAGRSTDHAQQSEMWVQSWHPQHPLYAALRQHDFAAFAASQLKEREAAGLPPFAHLAMLRADAKQAEAAQAFLQAAAELAANLPGAESVSVYAPVPLPVARVAGVERMQMMVESAARPALQRFLSQWVPALHELRRSPRHRVLRWAIDVDPLSI
ncbi:primosomal protein N' [Piscinibacter sp.]|jgi:primosomal protein N' (replication factor Y)|uniref:primosomal protein N' n=1 Tax=Piscinibacter sp. TaxID=1903157 RepID=UPI001B66153D|nr:primosomal protein N' [Piscinibacter sp.]MBK7533693.1 primosomal protein N' [Piscinibacter sp.]MBP6541108.1 primosomal protein N' [Piscinibacter sp.]